MNVWLSRGLMVLLGLMLCFPRTATAQALTDTADGTLAVVVNFASLTPGSSNTPATTSAQFRIRSKNATGYNVQVLSVTFVPTTTAPVAGGSTVAASDIGVGITSVTPAPGFDGILPRADVIQNGFNYNPGTVTAINGLSSYLGAASGQATLQDLITTPNTKILIGNKIHTKEQTNGAQAVTNYLTVTMAFGLVRQYFTPATFTAVITLRINDGP